MSTARRSTLPGVTGAEHTGLALHRLLKAHGKNEKNTHGGEHFQEVATLKVPEVYEPSFKRWEKALKALNTLSFTVTTTTPLAIGLGGASPLEVGLTLHHTYGVPYLPGSALKGLARRAAQQMGLDFDSSAQKTLFGDTSSSAYLTYWDALLELNQEQVLQSDVMTVHHQKYYSEAKDKAGKQVWPTDFDDPNPVPFLSVRPGVRFRVALSCCYPEWTRTAAELLEYGLTELGLWGKTNSGYGYFEVKLPEREKSEVEQSQELLERMNKRILGINGRNARGEVGGLLGELKGQPLTVRRPVLEAIKKQLEKFGLWDRKADFCKAVLRLYG